ncbi:MAG: MBL fold metallo-hydrolase [Thermodesulfobacteriota bacterium]|nr:MBL fold metallo-hydrolase [Thermodesulfobacteriota bacterium]
MSFRVSPVWWPILTLASPLIVPLLLIRNSHFRKGCTLAAEVNQKRISRAEPLDMPQLDLLEFTVLVEWEAKEGFIGDAGVSYFFKTELGSILYDVGFGPTRPAFTHNATKLGFSRDHVEALAISHLHGDHMGGINAQRTRQVTVPDELMSLKLKPCFLPDTSEAKGFKAELVEKPRLLAGGIASVGPLARSLFMLGYTEEQALLARIKDKGLVVFTGCGHPTIEVILEMVGHISNEPLYAVGGGLHFPVTGGRGNLGGIQFQTFIGTGKPPWQRINNEDLRRTINAINATGPKKVFLSGHDTCDYALNCMKRGLTAETEVLKAGATYRL